MVFHSYANNLVGAGTDLNSDYDVFVHDRKTGTNELVSVDNTGKQANFGSFGPEISANGRFVAFGSWATNLVVGDTNGLKDMFVHDRRTGLIERVNVDSNGIQADDHIFYPSVSGDGRFVAFSSWATNLVIGDTNGVEDVFVHTQDVDWDGIFDGVDTTPNTASDDFSDVTLGGTTTGVITARGDQVLIITEDPNPDGVRITADSSGGITPATVTVCGGASQLSLSPGDEVVVTCGSVHIEILGGTVEITFLANDSKSITTSIDAINSLTFDPETISFTASPTNTLSIVLLLEGRTYSLFPGETLSLQNTPPYLSSEHANVDVEEGSFADNDGLVSDADDDPIILTSSVGSVSNNNNGTWSWTYAAQDGPAENQTVTISADDGEGGISHTSFELNIVNVPPIVGLINLPLDPIQIDTELITFAEFTDPGIQDTHTAVWDWGDERSSPGDVDETDGSGAVTGYHTFADPGVYTVKVIVTDDDTGFGESIFQYAVVYDPDGGFVTGGGWINSPAGAYSPDPSLTGIANFGFVSKYKKGADTPTGQTEFQFHVADLNFHSYVYQWLVVAGPKAQFKGTGTINGAGNYGFMVTATDADLTPSTDVDLFRIKIWDKDNGDAIVYDNQLGDEDDADPTTEIGGGNIVIHKGK